MAAQAIDAPLLGSQSKRECLHLPRLAGLALSAAALTFCWRARVPDLKEHTSDLLETSDSVLRRRLMDLDRRMDGRVILPSADDFKQECVVWNQVSTLHAPPRGVIEVASEADVQLAIQTLASLNVPFSIRSGGHSKAGYSNSPDGIIISMKRLNQIEIVSRSADGGIAKMGPAIHAPEILDASLPHGLAAVLGFCPVVGEGGFVLGGGWGLLSRKHGLGLDNLLSANVVLASSELVVANDTHNADLFWALRGAGIGNFGVVTEMTYRLHPAQDSIQMSWLRVPAAEAPTFLARILAKNPPREMGMILEAMKDPPLAMQKMMNQTFTPMDKPVGFVLFWACPEQDCLEAGRAYLRDEIATLVSGTELFLLNNFTWRTNPATAASKNENIHLVQAFTGFLDVANATVDNFKTIIDTYKRWEVDMAPYVSGDIEFWGGRISDFPQNATAFPHRSAVYNLGVMIQVPRDKPEVFERHVQQLSREWKQIGHLLNGAYINYQMPSLGSNYAEAYWGPHVQRLQAIKRKCDPDNLFTSPQGIPTD